MIKLMLLEDLQNAILEEPDSLSMLRFYERDTGKVGELRKVFGFAWISLHERFVTERIILF